jgi:hypothetical protein
MFCTAWVVTFEQVTPVHGAGKHGSTLALVYWFHPETACQRGPLVAKYRLTRACRSTKFVEAKLHTAAPAEALYLPTGHGACDDDPAGQANPAAHRPVQAGDFSPVVLPYRPGGHMIGVDDVEVMPAAQYRPTVAVQAAPVHAPLMGAPVVEVLPGGHKVAKVATKLPAERLKAMARFTAGASAHGRQLFANFKFKLNGIMVSVRRIGITPVTHTGIA